jgi:hypothetical protein
MGGDVEKLGLQRGVSGRKAIKDWMMSHEGVESYV